MRIRSHSILFVMNGANFHFIQASTSVLDGNLGELRRDATHHKHHPGYSCYFCYSCSKRFTLFYTKIILFVFVFLDIRYCMCSYNGAKRNTKDMFGGKHGLAKKNRSHSQKTTDSENRMMRGMKKQ